MCKQTSKIKQTIYLLHKLVLVTQLCPTLCDPMDCCLPGSSVHGILQARIQEWVAIPFSRGPSQPRDRTRVSTLQADSLPSEPQGKQKLNQPFIMDQHYWPDIFSIIHLNIPTINKDKKFYGKHMTYIFQQHAVLGLWFCLLTMTRKMLCLCFLK